MKRIHLFTFVEWLIYGLLALSLFIILSPRLPTKNIFLSYVVPTGSMVPTIYPGSVVIVKPVTEVAKQDIIAFINPNDAYQMVLHRVVDISDKGYKTKGDANDTPDLTLVPKENVKGKMLFAIPLIGHLISLMKTKAGFILIVIIPSIFLIIINMKDILDGIREVKTKLNSKKLILCYIFFFLTGLLFGLSKESIIYAQYSANAHIQGISISAVATQHTPTPMPSPSNTPTPVPTATPTPSPTTTPGHSCFDINVVIEGNGAGSTNEVIITCTVNRIIMQFNNLFSVHSIHYEATYDSDEGHQGVLGAIAVDGESVITRDILLGTCSTDGCTSHGHTKNKKIKLKIDH